MRSGLGKPAPRLEVCLLLVQSKILRHGEHTSHALRTNVGYIAIRLIGHKASQRDVSVLRQDVNERNRLERVPAKASSP